MDSFGGYEAEFIETILERFKCSVCTKVLRDPELTVCCGQHFCGTCLLQWFKSQRKKSCPHCRSEGDNFQHVQNKSLKSEISQLKISCSNRSQGCEWAGELGNLKDHLKPESLTGCAFAEVVCTNKCGVKVPRSKLTDHMSTECKNRQETCQYCGKQDTFAAISEHKKVCPEFPLLCPNGCDSDTIPRENLAQHLAKCPLQKQTCPFEEAGCTEKMRPQEVDNHIQVNLMQHIKMLAEAFKDLKTKQENTDKELQSVREQYFKEKKSVQDMKQSLVFELKALEGSTSSDMQSVAYESIQTQLSDETNIMKKEDPTVFRINNFSKHVKNSETWYSQPFMIQHYKLCLAVHPRGIGSGFQSHASLSLVLLEVTTDLQSTDDSPTFSSLLCKIHILVPLLRLGAPGRHHRVYLSGVCGSNLDLSPLTKGEDRRILGTREEWLTYEIVQNELWKDSLVIKIEQVDDQEVPFDPIRAAMMRQAAMHASGGDCRQS